MRTDNLIPISLYNVTVKWMDFFGWQGARRRHSELWQRRTTPPDGSAPPKKDAI
jgi:hypothetical protein